MAKVRINFAISDEMVIWIQTQPAIDGMTISQNGVIIDHHMTAQQAQTLKTAFIDKLIEAI